MDISKVSVRCLIELFPLQSSNYSLSYNTKMLPLFSRGRIDLMTLARALLSSALFHHKSLPWSSNFTHTPTALAFVIIQRFNKFPSLDVTMLLMNKEASTLHKLYTILKICYRSISPSTFLTLADLQMYGTISP